MWHRGRANVPPKQGAQFVLGETLRIATVQPNTISCVSVVGAPGAVCREGVRCTGIPPTALNRVKRHDEVQYYSQLQVRLRKCIRGHMNAG
jgi:hypothetical protein